MEKCVRVSQFHQVRQTNICSGVGGIENRDTQMKNLLLFEHFIIPFLVHFYCTKNVRVVLENASNFVINFEDSLICLRLKTVISIFKMLVIFKRIGFIASASEFLEILWSNVGWFWIFWKILTGPCRAQTHNSPRFSDRWREFGASSKNTHPRES